jgi:hypothetical protein
LLVGAPPAFPEDPAQILERTSFQTAMPWSPQGNLRADVAMVYGIGNGLAERVRSWRERGYRVHLMTGVSWGDYQDYLYGRFDGVNHEDNAQTDRNGRKIGHGGDVYYMCPAENFGEYLCVGVQRGLDAGVEAVHWRNRSFGRGRVIRKASSASGRAFTTNRGRLRMSPWMDSGAPRN